MISILLPVYNGERFIKESIDSLINQTYTSWELLIGVNGSKDQSKKIVSNYIDQRIRIFDYGDDKGKGRTLNKLLLETKYDWIALQDHDDIWIEDKLERQIKFINDYDVIGTMITYIDEFGNYKGKPNLCIFTNEIIEKSLSGNNQIANTSVIFKKEKALEINGWSEDIDGIEDFDFWLRLIRKKSKIINLDFIGVNHRLHHSSNFNTKNYDLSKILQNVN